MRTKTSKLWFLGVILISLISNPAPSQEKKVLIPEGFRTYLVVDRRYDPKDERNRAGKFHCPVCENGLSPVLAVFSRSVSGQADDPLIPLLKLQNEIAMKYKSLRMGAFAIFLTLAKDFPDDTNREVRSREVSKFAEGTKLEKVILGLSEATVENSEKQLIPSPTLKAFGIEPNDEIVVIFYQRLTEIKRWKFTKEKPPTSDDLKQIAATVDSYLAKKIR